MSLTYHLAVDLGASSGRAILACFDGTKVETEEISRFRYPILHLAGHQFWNLPGIYQYVTEGIDKALAITKSKSAKLTSIGIDSWGCDVAAFNEDGTLAGLPYAYRDPHTDKAIEKFAEKLSLEEVYNRTGIQLMTFNTLFQLDTIRPKAKKILWIPDALAYMLTGNAVTEFTVATTSQMVNAATGDLDEGLLCHLGLERTQFGPMVQPGHVVGEYKGVPVISVAGHDTASAVIGIPAPTPDFAFLSCGTWSLMGVELPKPLINDKTREYNFSNEGGLDGSSRFLKNICGMWVFEQCRPELEDAPEDTGELVALCEKSDCESLINPDDVRFAHPVSMKAAIEEYCKETNQEVPRTAADFVRVIFQSLAKRYKVVMDILQSISGKEIKYMHVIGGGSKNSYLMQYTADELGMPVVAGPAESTALGNILVQLAACGLIPWTEIRQTAINSTSTKTYTPCTNQK